MSDLSPEASAPPPNKTSKLGCVACLVLLLLAGLGCGGITLGVFEAIKASIPYKDGLARVQADPRAREALGEPIRAGWWVNGAVQDKGNHGTATLLIPVEGPRGKATLDLASSKSQGLWTTGRALLSLESSGEVLDLMDPVNGDEPPSPPSPSPR
jgi:cytochrome oxidase complex assembly protein 1